MNRLFALLSTVALLMAQARGEEPASAFPPLPDLSAFQDDIDRWEEKIAALEAIDRQEPDPPGAVLLIGSSSIRLWKSAADDLSPYPVIRRGYGGAKYSDLAYYARRLITPHQFRAAVVFVGNDIKGSEKDKSPEEVGRLFGYVADVINTHQPNARILCVDVRPMPSRFGAWPQVRAGNAALKAACETRPMAHYVDTSGSYLTDDKQVREELYGEDRLHMAPAGYALWSELIKARLNEVLSDYCWLHEEIDTGASLLFAKNRLTR
jgi:hypothetical protein